jgi:hypothetical protein
MTSAMTERRKLVPFDPYYFEKQKRAGKTYSSTETFRTIFQSNHWGNPDSISGSGSSRRQTARIESELPSLVEEFKVRVLLDLPCGDYGWLRFVDLPILRYIGADIVPELVAANAAGFADAKHEFRVLDLTCDLLPEADLVLSRDCLVHLSFEQIEKSLSNLKRSPITYLLTTSFPECRVNEDIVTGDWRPLNLQAEPFGFPEPLRLVNEGCTEGEGVHRDKSLALWRIRDLP